MSENIVADSLEILSDEQLRDLIEQDEFFKAYFECALWSSTDNADDGGGEPLDANYDVDDFNREALLDQLRDCIDFKESQWLDLALAYGIRGYDAAQAGHDFWLTRNGHGAGFWDRGLADVGQRLSAASKVYGSVHIWVGDDGELGVN